MRLTIEAKYALQIIEALPVVAPRPKLVEQGCEANEVIGAKPRPAGRDHLEGLGLRKARPATRHRAHTAVIVLEPDAISVATAPLIDQDEGTSSQWVERMGDAHPTDRTVGTGCI